VELESRVHALRCTRQHALRPAQGVPGLMKATFFLGGGGIAADEMEYADRLGVPWVYIPCK